MKIDSITYEKKKLLVESNSSKSLKFTKNEFYRDSTNSLEFINDKPSKQSIDKLLNSIEKSNDKLQKNRRKSIKNDDDQEDVTFINEKNAVFNKKISKAFDKYTKEIKDNLERGTAL
jgi:pre-mRNA-splicing factor SYF2